MIISLKKSSFILKINKKDQVKLQNQRQKITLLSLNIIKVNWDYKNYISTKSVKIPYYMTSNNIVEKSYVVVMSFIT